MKPKRIKPIPVPFEKMTKPRRPTSVTPVFAVYVSVKDLSPLRAQEKFTNVKKMIQRQNLHNIGQFFFLPTNGEDKIDCVWPKYIVIDKEDAQTLLEKQRELTEELQKRAL